MSQFHPLRVATKESETGRAITLQLAVDAAAVGAFQYRPGQHIVLRARIDGEEIRRTYSLCTGSFPGRLNLCIRSDQPGRMTSYVRDRLQVGSTIDVFPPTGRFGLTQDSVGTHYLAVAAGIGITPLLSIVSGVLESRPDARVTLLYCNRSADSVLFAEDLQALKDRHLSRFSLHFFMSREQQELDHYNGRIDAAKIRATAAAGFDPAALDGAFVCAPETMMMSVCGALQELGLASSAIHVERFATSVGEHGAPARTVEPAAPQASEPVAGVTVKMDGRTRSFQMPRDGSISVLDAAAKAGIDLPYSCKGGVCSTCRTHLASGSVRMDLNYALEDSEVEAGFVLTCQAVPTSADIELDYDTR